MAAWIARRAISLPVPDSPRMSTVESYGATCWISRFTAPTAGETPVGSCTPSMMTALALLRSSALRATPSPCAPKHSSDCTLTPLSGSIFCAQRKQNRDAQNKFARDRETPPNKVAARADDARCQRKTLSAISRVKITYAPTADARRQFFAGGGETPASRCDRRGFHREREIERGSARP